MYIHGEFRDVNNVLYSVHILSDNDKTQEITIGENGLFFSGSPISIETDIDDTFQTIIKRSASINLVTKSYLGDKLFANNSRNIKVNIYKEDLCIYAGFVEPNTFSQPFAKGLEEFTINTTDALTTLQYYNYNDITLKNFDEAKKKASTKSFKEMFNYMMQDLFNLDIVNNTSSVVYYDLSKGIEKGKESTILDDCSMSELYLIGDEADDVWTNEEVLEQILQYLNLHIIQDGLDYYIFDWNSIKDKKVNWYNMNINSEVIMNPLDINMTSEMHSTDNTNISISDVYNQISLTCDLEDQEDVINSPMDSNSEDLLSLYKSKQKYMTEYISEGEGKTAYNAFFDMIHNRENNYKDSKIVDWYLQAMYNKNWNFITPDGKITDLCEFSNNIYINQWKIPKYLKDNQLIPSLFKLGKVEKKEDKQDNSPTSKIDMSSYLFISINGNGDDSEEKHSPTDQTIQDRSGMIEYIGNNSGGVFSPTDDKTINYLVFSGKMCLMPIQKETEKYSTLLKHDKDDGYWDANGMWKLDFWHKTVSSDNNGDGRYYTRKWYTQEKTTDEPTTYLDEYSLHPLTQDKSNHELEYKYTAKGDSTDKFSKLPILECELIIGNKRLIETNIDIYGNSTFKWVKIGEEPTVDGVKLTTFSLGVNPKIGDKIIGDEFDIQNTINYTMNLDAEGTAIPIKKDDALSGAVVFRILGPINLTWDDVTRRHPTWFRHTTWTTKTKFILAHLENIIIKDFECKVYTDNGGNESNQDKDLIYMSDETDKFVNKKDDIDFKFITQLSSDECLQKGIQNSININAVINTTTGTPIENIYNATTKETAKPEEHYINQYYLAYSKPKLIMETDLHDTDDISIQNIFHSKVLNRNFFVQSIDRDLLEASAHITLKEI